MMVNDIILDKAYEMVSTRQWTSLCLAFKEIEVHDVMMMKRVCCKVIETAINTRVSLV